MSPYRRVMSFSCQIYAVAVTLFAAAIIGGCGRKPADPGTPAPTPETAEAAASSPAGTPATTPRTAPPAATPSLPKFPVSTKPAPAELWREFDGARALAAVQRQVDVGPRPSGTAELEKARKLIIEELEKNGWEVERQEFKDRTPHSEVQFTNLIARFAADGARPVPRNTQRAIVCSHYDTKRFSTIRFLGANDAGSSTGALLELSRVLALDPKLAAKIELVFFDGEEAVVQFTETDGLYGSRFYAKSLRDSKTNSQYQFGILWDMIGEIDLTITLPPDSPAELAKGIIASAETLGLRQHFSFFDRQILDDHVPLNTIARIPSIDLIDFNYLWWHTADDTMARLHPDSLKKVGATTLHYLHSRLK